MLKKLPFIFALILFTNCMQAQENSPQIVVDNQLISQSGVSRTELIEFAKTFLGTIYCYGGSTPEKGFDCSGFVSFVFNHFNIKLPRSSQDYKSVGVKQKPEDFKVGDILVFYGYKDKTLLGHVGIICEANGMNSKFIHASSGKVKEVIISELNSTHYTERFYKCIDVIEP